MGLFHNIVSDKTDGERAERQAEGSQMTLALWGEISIFFPPFSLFLSVHWQTHTRPIGLIRLLSLWAYATLMSRC